MYRYIKIFLPLVFLAFLLFGAAAGFAYFENLSLFDALWMTITTVMTVGYGDLIPSTFESKILAILLIPLCIILFTYFMGLIIGFIVEFNISPFKRSRRMEKKIKRLHRHIIICGFNTMSSTIIDRIIQEKRDFVLIESDETKCDNFIEKYNIVIGDPFEEDVLKRAGIEKAEGLITTLSDAENVLIALTAREMNPSLLISSSAERIESESKLRKAGANRVINPERIGGTRMALSVLMPAAVDYMDRVFTSSNENFKIEELFLTENSKLVGKTIKDAEIRNRFDLSVMAVNRGNRIMTSGLADMMLAKNDIIIIFGMEENLQRFRELMLADRV